VSPVDPDDTNPYRTPESEPPAPKPEPLPKNGLDLMRAIVTDSIRYWEFMRLIYNGVLTLVVIGSVFLFGVSFAEIERLIGLAGLAILANILYCIVYPIDVFIQLSDYRTAWRRARILVFVSGLIFASSLAVASIYILQR
jgi:hypothetical protein